MANYVTAQHVGTEPAQCDAVAVHTAPSGARAYALLDGYGRGDTVPLWVAREVRRVARAASRRGDAGAGLRHIYQQHATDPARQDPERRLHLPKAAAVVAVSVPGGPLTVAWCGDSRAYLLHDGTARRLTEDHNGRRVQPANPRFPKGGSRHFLTTYLGNVHGDEETLRSYLRHRTVDSVTLDPDGPCRLLLATDGAYEPHEAAGHDLAAQLDGALLRVAVRDFVDVAVEVSVETDGKAGNASALLAELG
ncbi:PP2C family serine/threonine-protein phosphatase [Streptomyces cinereoruber]|uniref:PP2C family serine/threonine-protein phosphatase n=1 Tax=Streptomyces cinereoruber TaxID=67260 RepID=UPI003632A3CF